MNRTRRLLLAIGIAAVLCGAPPDASGDGGQPAGGEPSCRVDTLGDAALAASGAIALRGTVAVEVTSNIGLIIGPHDVDFTLRLERGGAQRFFRLHLFTSLGGLSNEEIICRMLNPSDTGDSAVLAFVNQILTAFGLPSDRRLVIRPDSLSDTDAAAGGTLLGQGQLQIGGTLHASAVANVTIYAVNAP